MARLDIRRPVVWVPALLGIALVALVVLRVIEARTPVDVPPTVEQIRATEGVPVRVAEVDRGSLEVWRTFNGTVSGAQEAVVRARTGDEVASVAVDVGSRVQRGQLLVRQVGESTAARVRQAEAARIQAERTVERLRPLHEAGAISDQDWDQALTQLELASADAVAAADLTTLTSPLTGVVTEVQARPGMIPSPGDPLVRVADLSELVVYLRVSATDVREIREGQRARIEGAGSSGTVRRVALQADPATRLVEVEVGFPPGAGLVPGTLATVGIEVASADDIIFVPRSAVRDDVAWVLRQDGTVERRQVTTGLATADRIEIRSGLEPGDTVVIEGAALLVDGATVRITGNSSAGSAEVN